MPTATPTAQTTLTVALIGNPNTGKSTLFTALAGVRQRVGNFPGVTVEKKVGHLRLGELRLALVDLPGAYSLAPRSPDEMVAVDVLLGRREDTPRPDAVLCIVDASNLERNLYLVSQVLELGLPTVVALNMTDLAEQRGMTIDDRLLEKRLQTPVVRIQANRHVGIDHLKEALAGAINSPARATHNPFPEAFRQEVSALDGWLAEQLRGSNTEPWPRYLTERLLLDTGGYLQQFVPADVAPAVSDRLIDARRRLVEAGCAAPGIEALARYEWVAKMLDGVVARPQRHQVTTSDRIDRVLTHKVVGTVVFALLMLLMFVSIYMFASYPMDWIDGGIGAIQEWTAAALADTALAGGALESLLIDGVLGGVGSVVIFLPQILILFCFIAILEDCGYMARAAYLMDKLMVKAGLSGKSFIPLLSSFACAVPGIMAARVIENRRDRLTTILVAPLMSCSARIPVYVILIAVVIPSDTSLGLFLPALVMFSMYLLGIVVAVLVAVALKKTLLKGATPPFVMELPSYKWPSVRMVVHRMLDRGWAFLKRAGTLIFAVSLIIWAMLYYPRDPDWVAQDLDRQKQAAEARLADAEPGTPQWEEASAEVAAFDDEDELAAREASSYQRYSLLGRMGRWIEPVVRPLGWDWRIGCAAIASFPAREVVMGVLGVIYNMGSDVDVGDEEQQGVLADKLRAARWDDTGEPVYTLPAALSLMVFFALCAQCAATLAVIKRETNSWRWPLFSFAYMTVLAYIGALATYQIGRLLLA